jgi:hypothetical protein
MHIPNFATIINAAVLAGEVEHAASGAQVI